MRSPLLAANFIPGDHVFHGVEPPVPMHLDDGLVRDVIANCNVRIFMPLHGAAETGLSCGPTKP